MAQFNFDKRALEQAAKPAMRQMGSDGNRAMAQFHRQYLGKPVETVKPALKRVWEKNFGKIDDRKLTEYATMVSQGSKISFRAG